MLARLANGARAARDAHLRLLLKLVRSIPAFAVTYGASDIVRLPEWLDARRAMTDGATG
jgi:hypothetical protein